MKTEANEWLEVSSRCTTDVLLWRLGLRGNASIQPLAPKSIRLRSTLDGDQDPLIIVHKCT